jgi:hypothetical protein
MFNMKFEKGDLFGQMVMWWSALADLKKGA